MEIKADEWEYFAGEIMQTLQRKLCSGNRRGLRLCQQPSFYREGRGDHATCSIAILGSTTKKRGAFRWHFGRALHTIAKVFPDVRETRKVRQTMRSSG